MVLPDDLKTEGISAPKTGPECGIEIGESPEGGLNALRTMNAGLHTEVLRTIENKKLMDSLANPVGFSEYSLVRRKKMLQQAITVIVGDIAPEDILLPETPSHVNADFSIRIPKKQKDAKNFLENVLPLLMHELPKKLPWLAKLDQQGMYLNVTLDRASLINDTLHDVEELDDLFGCSDVNRGKKVVLDYSSPNTAKTMHVGHLRSTIIGQVMVNLLKATGAVTYGINHLGDWGTQFGNLITGYRLWGEAMKKEINPEQNPVGYLAALYRKITGGITEEEKSGETVLADEGRANFTALEKGDHTIVSLWQEFRRLSLVEFEMVYERLGVDFDFVLGESFYEDRMKSPVQEAIAKGVAKKGLTLSAQKVVLENAEKHPERPLPPDGLVVDLTDVKKGDFYLLKHDGSSVYHTRDIAAIRYRMDTFDADYILYVVGAEQKSHLSQCFEVAKRLGDIDGDECKHLAFGLVKQGDAKIASREGKTVGLNDLLDELQRRAKEGLQQRYPDWNDESLTRTAEQISVAALVYTNFVHGMERDIQFDLDKMLDLKEQSGPYLQYTCVRAKRILKKAQEKLNGAALSRMPLSANTVGKFPSDVLGILMLVSKFPEVVAVAASKNIPHHLAEYLSDLAIAFNAFYTSGVHILDEPDIELQQAYLRMCQAVVVTLDNGLEKFNIQVPDRM